MRAGPFARWKTLPTCKAGRVSQVLLAWEVRRLQIAGHVEFFGVRLLFATVVEPVSSCDFPEKGASRSYGAVFSAKKHRVAMLLFGNQEDPGPEAAKHVTPTTPTSVCAHKKRNQLILPAFGKT